MNFYGRIKYYGDDVLKLLTEYFQIMKATDYSINKEGSNQIGIDYIMKIGYYYSGQAGFKMKMKLDFAIFRGILADLLLLISGLLKQVYYIPIVTLLLLIYWSILKLYYEKRGRIFNTGY